MARTLRKPLMHDLVAVADLLARQAGPVGVVQASRRRAVSTAYYALFHALCFVCADALVGWSRKDALAPIYRSLEHTTARKKLRSDEAKLIDHRIARLGLFFSTLQEQRHAADYAPPGSNLSRTQTLDLIDDARDAVALIEDLDTRARLDLAILLIARQRAA